MTPDEYQRMLIFIEKAWPLGVWTVDQREVWAEKFNPWPKELVEEAVTRLMDRRLVPDAIGLAPQPEEILTMARTIHAERQIAGRRRERLAPPEVEPLSPTAKHWIDQAHQNLAGRHHVPEPPPVDPAEAAERTRVQAEMQARHAQYRAEIDAATQESTEERETGDGGTTESR